MRAVIVAALLATAGFATPFSFTSIGDWGCMLIGGYHANDELVVSKQFASASEALEAKFVLNTGDNFYYCGVHNVTDPQFKNTYEAIFHQPSMQVPWYGCLGNHDYGYPGSAEAEIQYVSTMANGENRWIMPDRYYNKRLTFPEVNISLVVVDASPCQSAYRANNPANWDPCGSVIPGCPGCTFHENVVAQSCAKQLTWLKSTLQTVPADDWKIAMSHAPAEELDVEDLTSEFQASKFDMFINGHVHILGQYQIDGAGTYITTGAGCMVRVSQDLKDAVKGGRMTKDEMMLQARADSRRDLRAKLKSSSCSSWTKSTHKCTPIWEEKIAGYTTHTFSADFQTLTTTFFDAFGNNLHSLETKKGGGNPSPAPTTPTTTGTGTNPPAPPGACCFFHDATCTAGQTCCNDRGLAYHQQACDASEGQKHNCKWTGETCVVGN